MISAASPIWTVLLGRIFLKEPLKPLDILNVVITLTGILFIIRPPFIFGYDPNFELDHQYYTAAMIVFGGTFLQATVYILLRFTACFPSR
jgi:drug/metabolite transporter (DMT)-like permease